MMDIDWSKAPKGATHYDPTKLGGYPSFMKWDGTRWEYFSKCHHEWMPHAAPGREEYIPRPKAPEADWVDGVPPVGCECEYRPDPSSNFWDKCAYLAHFDGEHFVLVLDTGNVDRMPDRTPAHERFRPISTKEQRERDETIIEALRHAPMNTDDEIHPRQYLIDSLHALYDAGLLRKGDS